MSTNLFKRPIPSLKSFDLSSVSKSACSSPQFQKSLELSSREGLTISSQQTINKSNYSSILKTLEELGSNLELLTKRFKNYDKEVCEIIQNCEKKVKITKQKVFDMSAEETFSRLSDTNGLQEVSTILKPEVNEYCKFLEHLLAYEQAKGDLIMKKSKFPKIRLKEVDKVLSEEFSIKTLNSLKTVKNNESSFLDKSNQEIKQLVMKIKKNITNNAKIPDELIDDMEKSTADFSTKIENCSEFVNSIESFSVVKDSKRVLQEKLKIESLFENLSKDHKKLSAKYTYLINKLNKQDITVKHQSRIIGSMASNLALLKEQFLQFNEEIKFYISLLIENLSEKGSNKCSIIITSSVNSLQKSSVSVSPSKVLKNEQSILKIEAEKECLQKENTLLKEKILELESQLKELTEKCKDFGKEVEKSEDSLDLSSNIKDIIEIQKLKDQIRLLNFKGNESLTQHQKELDSFKSQISKVKADKFSLEERVKSLNKKVQELAAEKEALFEENAKYKVKPPESPRPIARLSIETFNAGEFSSRSEAPKVNPSDIISLMQEEIDEIANKIKTSKIITQSNATSIETIKKIIDFLCTIKQDLGEDSGEFSENLKKAVEIYRKSKSLTDNHEKFLDYESALLNVDPEAYLIEKQLEIYKSKLADKKNQLALHKQQITYLKKSVKDLQSEIDKKNNIVDIECLQEMFRNIVKEIPALAVNTEQLILVMMKTLGFGQNEVSKLTFERRSRKQSNFFQGIFH